MNEDKSGVIGDNRVLFVPLSSPTTHCNPLIIISTKTLVTTRRDDDDNNQSCHQLMWVETQNTKQKTKNH